jgi:GDPmannose 4,6-dehydratase
VPWVHDQPRRALITGVAGQDGSYLAELLLGRGLEVHGTLRRPPAEPHPLHVPAAVQLHVADLEEPGAVERVVAEVAPDDVYNLAGSTSVAESWSQPASAAAVMGVGAVRILEAAWQLYGVTGRAVRVLQASSAEIYGDPDEVPQSELTPLRPVTPYGAAKAFAHQMTSVYRNRGLHAASAVLYNHESPRRPATFVSRKIAQGVAQIACGQRDVLVLGNISVTRDWGYAPDFVEAMALILAADDAEDVVVATGEAHSVEAFVAEAFAAVGIDDHRPFLRQDSALLRPADPRSLVGDPARLKELGWRPSMSFQQLVRLMVDDDLARLRAHAPQ